LETQSREDREEKHKGLFFHLPESPADEKKYAP
jgi:hypothetical protein